MGHQTGLARDNSKEKKRKKKNLARQPAPEEAPRARRNEILRSGDPPLTLIFCYYMSLAPAGVVWEGAAAPPQGIY